MIGERRVRIAKFYQLYRAGRLVIRKILKMRIWGTRAREIHGGSCHAISLRSLPLIADAKLAGLVLVRCEGENFTVSIVNHE